MKALLYRELIWFKRFLADYIVSWVLPSAISFMIIYLPVTISDVNVVIDKFSSIVGVRLDITSVIIVTLIMSSLIPVVSVVINDIIQTLFSEFKFLEVSSTILETTTIRRYLLANALVRPILMTFFVTMYLIPALTAVLGLHGLVVYIYIELALQLTSMVLGLYAALFAMLITFYTNISRPWSIANSIPPAILAGSGIYLQAYSIPPILRLFAQTTPVPQAVELIQVIALGMSAPNITHFLAVTAVLLSTYLTLTGFMGVKTDIKVRK